MARSVNWSEPALDDVTAAAEYIARDSHHFAALLEDRATVAARSLAAFPERGRVVPELEDPAVREIFVHAYRLIYEIHPDRIDILAFVHAARDLAGLWQRGPDSNEND